MNASSKSSAERRDVGVLCAASVGIGGMVGGGIFAVLGLAVELARGAVPLAFAPGGTIALISAYSYVRLSVRFPDRGGTVSYLDRAFGPSMGTGILNVLLLLSCVVMIAFYAAAFGLLGASFFGNDDSARRILVTVAIFGLTAVNPLGTGFVLRVENLINAVAVAVAAMPAVGLLICLVAVTIMFMQMGALELYLLVGMLATACGVELISRACGWPMVVRTQR